MTEIFYTRRCSVSKHGPKLFPHYLQNPSTKPAQWVFSWLPGNCPRFGSPLATASPGGQEEHTFPLGLYLKSR